MNSTSSRKEEVMFRFTVTSLAFFAIVLTVAMLGMILVGSASADTAKPPTVVKTQTPPEKITIRPERHEIQ